MKYLAILYPGETLEDCWRICRKCSQGFERYKVTTDTWEYDPELSLIYTGEPETEVITEEQANAIINQIKERYTGVSNSKSRTQRAN